MKSLESADPPTKINHNRFVRPFEELTKLYGLPHYDEVDPTPIMAITFPIIFGLMFGDLGHGLILLFGGLAVGLLIKGNKAMKNVCYIMAACGLGASIAGLVFGEAFGQQHYLGPLWINPTENPTVNVFTFIIFSLFVGVIQIISGIVLEMTNFALKHQYSDALLTSAPKIAFYVGGVYLIAAYQLNFGAWLHGPILWPLLSFIVFLVVKPTLFESCKTRDDPWR